MITPAYIATRKGTTFDATQTAQLRAKISDVTELLVRFTNNDYDSDNYILADTISFDGDILDSDSGFEFSSGQWIRVEGSDYNDGFYYLDTATSGTLGTYPETETEAAEEDVSIYSQFFPQGLKAICSSMAYYDVFDRGNERSETIGTYSYTLQDIGGIGYPENIIQGLMQYKKPQYF